MNDCHYKLLVAFYLQLSKKVRNIRHWFYCNRWHVLVHCTVPYVRYFHLFTLVRIRIQLSTLMRIRSNFPKLCGSMRIWIRNNCNYVTICKNSLSKILHVDTGMVYFPPSPNFEILIYFNFKSAVLSSHKKRRVNFPKRIRIRKPDKEDP